MIEVLRIIHFESGKFLKFNENVSTLKKIIWIIKYTNIYTIICILIYMYINPCIILNLNLNIHTHTFIHKK